MRLGRSVISAGAVHRDIGASKRKHYDKYYRSFARFVITLSGSDSQASAEALAGVMKAVARVSWIGRLPAGRKKSSAA